MLLHLQRLEGHPEAALEEAVGEATLVVEPQVKDRVVDRDIVVAEETSKEVVEVQMPQHQMLPLLALLVVEKAALVRQLSLVLEWKLHLHLRLLQQQRRMKRRKIESGN